MKDQIFRAYDIRGVVGSEFEIDQVYDLGRAIALYLEEQNPTLRTVAIGMDGRTHSPYIKEELSRALRMSGIDVIFIGICITPVAYFAEYWLPVDAALMITASHNPKEYNGIKITAGKKPVASEQIQAIKKYYKEKKYIISDIIGSYIEYDLVTQYVDYLVRLFPHLVGSSYPMVFDCGNGASGRIMMQLVQKMEWNYATLLYSQVDGTYPNHTADPTELENMQDLLAVITAHKIPFGIGFDGDADRMGVITDQGKLVGGDVLLSGWARALGSKVGQGNVVYDAKCSDGLSEIITQSGLTPLICPSGHSFIKQSMAKNKALLAGELSCHFFFHDRYFGFDDGIYAALRLLELITTYTTSLDTILSLFPRRESSPELRIACSYASDYVVDGVRRYFEDKQDRKITEIDGIRVDTERGWGLLRGSHTQPVICLRFEAYTSDDLQEIKKEFICALEPYFSKQFLEKQVTW